MPFGKKKPPPAAGKMRFDDESPAKSSRKSKPKRKGSFLGFGGGGKKDDSPKQPFDMGDQRMTMGTKALATPSMKVGMNGGGAFNQPMQKAVTLEPPPGIDEPVFPRPSSMAPSNDPRRGELATRLVQVFSELGVGGELQNALEWGLVNGEGALSDKLLQTYGKPLPKPAVLEASTPNRNALQQQGSFIEYDVDEADPHSSFVALVPPVSPMGDARSNTQKSSNLQRFASSTSDAPSKSSHVDSIDFSSKPAASEEDFGPGVCERFKWAGKGSFGVCQKCAYSRLDHNDDKRARDKARLASVN